MNTREPDDSHYLRRLLAAAGWVVLAVALFVLFGPRADPKGEWYKHVGIGGPIRIVDNIEVVPDRPSDETSPLEQRRSASTTQGVEAVIGDDVVADTPNPVPLDQKEGSRKAHETEVQRDDESTSRRDDPRSQVRRSRPVQSSPDFVLLESVSPRYPVGVSAAMRQREVEVRVAMWVDETGHVTESYIESNTGGPAFAEAVLEAVRRWVYKPYLIEGKPEGFWDHVGFTFNVEGSRDRPTKGPRSASQG